MNELEKTFVWNVEGDNKDILLQIDGEELLPGRFKICKSESAAFDGFLFEFAVFLAMPILRGIARGTSEAIEEECRLLAKEITTKLIDKLKDKLFGLTINGQKLDSMNAWIEFIQDQLIDVVNDFL